jgi:hypothetical protein
MDVKLSLTLSEDHSLRVFENRVVRRIFGSKRVKVRGEWRELYGAELRIVLIPKCH